MDHSHIRAYFLAIVTTLLTVLVVYMLRPFLVTIGLAAVFAVIFTPLHKRLQRAKLPEVPAALLSLLIGMLCFVIPLALLSVQLFKEAQNVYAVVSQPGTITQAQAAVTSLGHSIDKTIPGAAAYLDSVSANLGTYARTALGWGLNHASAVLSGTFSFALQLFVFLMTLYYLLKEGPRVRVALERFSPLSNVETLSLINRLKHTINSVVRGTLLVALIQGILTTIGFFIFGVPNPVLWGTITIFSSLIPTVGTALVFVPAVLYLFFVGHVGACIGLALFALLGVGTVDNFLRPYLMSGKASIHPLLILLAVLSGVAFFGAGGLFLGPLVISLLLGLLSIYAPAEGKE